MVYVAISSIKQVSEYSLMYSQSIIWSFITEYKKVLGKDLTYLQLIQSQTTMQQVIDSALATKHTELHAYCKHIFMSGHFKFIKSSPNGTEEITVQHDTTKNYSAPKRDEQQHLLR